MINIHMREDQFNNLIQLNKSNKEEISGTIQIKQSENDILIDKILIGDNDIYQERSPKYIEYDVEKWLPKTFWNLYATDIPYYVMFHTHPGLRGAPRLSDADKDMLKYIQSLTEKIPGKENTLVIEGIITRQEIAFYSYDENTQEILNIPLFVNGEEKKLSKNQSFLEAFREGFRRESRR